MKKILITGGTGFVGRAVVESLLSEDMDLEIHLLVFKTDFSPYKALDMRKNIICHRCSLLDYDKTNGIIQQVRPDYLIHLAWYVRDVDYLAGGENLLWVGASLNLLKTFAFCGGKRALMCGTCFEYDFREAPLKETDKINPLYVYARCKASLHDIAEKYAENNGFEFVWFRLFYLFGEGEFEKRVVPYIIKNIMSGNAVTCKNSEAVRDYMYVRDAGNAIVRTMFSSVKGTVNIASGRGITMGQVFETIAEEMGHRELVILERNPTVPQSIVADVSRLREEIGFGCCTEMGDGLRNTINWWKG